MIEVPAELAKWQAHYRGDEGRAWVAGLPALAESYLDRWALRPDGGPRHGMVALVLPVVTATGVAAVLKLQQRDEEHHGEGDALRIWAGDGAVQVLDEGPDALLLERLDADRPLSTMADDVAAAQVIAGLLARLHRHRHPPGIRPLRDVVTGMLDLTPELAEALGEADERRLLRDWAAITADVAAEPGDHLLHWDLHYDNVLASDREPWLAIDPKPLTGDPGFDLCPALWNRWDEAVASGDPAAAVLRRFDAMTEVLNLPRDRAAAWTTARLLQNALWDIEAARKAGAAAATLARRLVAVDTAMGKRRT